MSYRFLIRGPCTVWRLCLGKVLPCFQPRSLLKTARPITFHIRITRSSSFPFTKLFRWLEKLWTTRLFRSAQILTSSPALGTKTAMIYLTTTHRLPFMIRVISLSESFLSYTSTFLDLCPGAACRVALWTQAFGSSSPESHLSTGTTDAFPLQSTPENASYPAAAWGFSLRIRSQLDFEWDRSVEKDKFHIKNVFVDLMQLQSNDHACKKNDSLCNRAIFCQTTHDWCSSVWKRLKVFGIRL